MKTLQRSVLWVLFLSLPLLLASCSSSEEISESASTPDGEEAVFERVDREETIIPETDVPSEARPAQQQPAPIERTVPVQPQSDLPAAQEAPAVPARQQTQPVPAQQPAVDTKAATDATPSGTMMWSVQLGAFKSEAGALQLIEEVKKKFNQPVYKRYDAVTGFYKVTLGSYQLREDAARFKLDVQSRGYPDAFVVEVAR
jgi:cell division septation protein DedD